MWEERLFVWEGRLSVWEGGCLCGGAYSKAEPEKLSSCTLNSHNMGEVEACCNGNGGYQPLVNCLSVIGGHMQPFVHMCTTLSAESNQTTEKAPLPDLSMPYHSSQ